MAANDDRALSPIFKPIRDRFKPFGLSVPVILGIIGACLLGLMVTVALGNIKHDVEREYTQAELVNIKAEYTNIATDVTDISLRAEKEGVKVSDLKLSGDEQKTMALAAERKIKSGMSSDEIDSILPRKHIVQEDLIPAWLRAFAFIAGPAIVGVALFIEVNRTTLMRELMRGRKYARSQKQYRNRPMTYVERECGCTYWEACAAAEEEDTTRAQAR